MSDFSRSFKVVTLGIGLTFCGLSASAEMIDLKAEINTKGYNDRRSEDEIRAAGGDLAYI